MECLNQDRGHRQGSQEGSQDSLSWPFADIGRILSPRSVAESDGEKDWDMGEPQDTRAAGSPGSESPAGRADVILTPDQRVRVFISSTLEELAAERAAARRAIARLRPRPSWPEWHSTARWPS